MNQSQHSYTPTSQEYDIPKWKQDLMQRKKSTSRTIVSAGGAVKLTVSCPASMIKSITANRKNSLQGNRPHSIHIDTSTRQSSGEMFKEYNPNYSKVYNHTQPVFLDDNIKDNFFGVAMKRENKNKPKVNIKLKINDEDYHSDSSDDGNISPGMNIIKNKYLTKCSSPPPVSNLEKRAVSLEDIQQIDSTRLKPKYDYKKRPCQFKVNQYQAKYLEKINESNKSYNQDSSSRMNEETIPGINNIVKQRAKMFEANPELKIEKPSWRRQRSSNKITVIFKDRSVSLCENNNKNISNNEGGSVIETKPNTPTTATATKSECLVATKFTQSNHVFPEITPLENCPMTNHTVACM